MRLLVVIVNYRTAKLTVDCLHSLAGETGALGAKVVVTDNLSGDDSIDVIKNAIAQNNWSPWASLMPLDRNGGFAFGNNAAIRPALESPDPPDYVLLLNPDTVVHPGALKALVDFMDDRAEVGIAGSRLEHPDGTPQRSAFRFHSVLSEWEAGLRLGLVSRLLRKQVVAPPVPQEPCPTDWVAGASMIIRRLVFARIGLLDEGYFMYFEEVDFCLRAKRAGWPCWYVPASRVVHLVGQSSGVTDIKQAKKRRPTYWFESRKRFFTRNFGRLPMAAANVAWASAFATYRLRQFIQRKPDTDPARLLRDFLRHAILGDRR
ncbi:MAG TPA: glycosyltransferase family 2 protein [Tepidisphaeraceae bacterium]|nr:glycosyltransferase family 2 protein [Tepidisphaeraceae bacterium]